MKDSGCGSILIGLESVSSQNLTRMNKRLNLRFNYLDAIQKIQSYGILVHGSFILGSDFDDLSAFDELIHFIKEAKLLMPLINILTPFREQSCTNDWMPKDAYYTKSGANMTPDMLCLNLP